MAKAEYKILMKCSQDFEEEERTISMDAEDAAEELSADVSAHLRDGWSLHGSLSVCALSQNGHLTFTQALFKPSGTKPGGTKPVVTKRQRE